MKISPEGQDIHVTVRRVGAQNRHVFVGCVDYRISASGKMHQSKFIYELMGNDPRQRDHPGPVNGLKSGRLVDSMPTNEGRPRTKLGPHQRREFASRFVRLAEQS